MALFAARLISPPIACWPAPTAPPVTAHVAAAATVAAGNGAAKE